MLLLVLVGLLTTWIGVALTDHGRRIKGERLGVEITAIRDLMQTFVDLHGDEIKNAFLGSSGMGVIKVRGPLPDANVKETPVNKVRGYLEFDSSQISAVARVLDWANHMKSDPFAAEYFVRIRGAAQNGMCTVQNKDECTLQLLVYRKSPLTFLSTMDTVAVQSAIATMGRGGGASVSLGKPADATHFRFPSHTKPTDSQSAFFENPSNEPGAIAALSDRATTYQPFLHRDGGKLNVELNMNDKNIVNVGEISGITNIRSAEKLVVEAKNGEGKIEFSAGNLSSKNDFNVTSGTFTFQASPDPKKKIVKITAGHIEAAEITVDTLHSAKPVQFHPFATLNAPCIGSQISFTHIGEPAYCQTTWKPFKRVETKIEKTVCPICPEPPPPDPKRDPLFKEGTMKWVAHSAQLTFRPADIAILQKSVFFLGSEWNHCAVVIDSSYRGGGGRLYLPEDLVQITRSKFTAQTRYNDELTRLGKEASWQMVTTPLSAQIGTVLTYTVTCHRPAFRGADNHWHMGKLSPLTGDFANEAREPKTYRHPEFHRIERLTLVRDPGQ